MKPNLIHFRHELEKFIIFNEEEWMVFVDYLEYKRYPKKSFFIQPGEVSKYVGFILKGAMRYFHVKEGIEITGYFSFEDEWVSAYKSFLTQTINHNYIQAIEETEMILISKEKLIQMADHPLIALKVEQFCRRIAEHYICCYEDRISTFILQSPEERYLELQKNTSHILQRIPQHYIANYLGITPVSLSRIRRRTLKIS